MNDGMRPSSWPSAFLTGCLAILAGAWALSWAISLMRPLLPWLAAVLLVSLGVRVGLSLLQGRNDW